MIRESNLAMAVSIGIIKESESCVLKAYRTKLKGGKLEEGWTIGWGHHGPDVKEGDTITQEEADQLLMSDYANTMEQVNKVLGDAKVNPNMLCALVSLVFNIGVGDFKSSTLLKKIKAKDYVGAALEFNKWRRAGGDILPGLEKRRMKEQALFLGFVNDFGLMEFSSEPTIYTPDPNLNR